MDESLDGRQHRNPGTFYSVVRDPDTHVRLVKRYMDTVARQE